ncbi:radical SAM protein [Pelovirga terrestris]|uniref:Radical SAM protein n=1 Tax=Pelovirga terrestris TaxID=2771352 RepID=A0A8J6QR19_9BACT|nr:radical SAM protein [Pelovirga terrestris]MBD1401711.1 radical SAM protein [Pelovirga terrestris]
MSFPFSYNEPLFRPPSEARSLIFQVTIGCSQNTCGFCGMYKMKRFSCRPLNEVVAEIESIPAVYRPQIQRVFLGDGDGLVYPQDRLLEVLDRLAQTFPNLARVSAYASPNSLTTKSVAEMTELRRKKLRILYFGLESGDPDTLLLANKGFSPEQMRVLCQNAQAAGQKLSITAILGLAGRKRSSDHAQATAAWINGLSPEYFSLLTMFRRHNDAYFTKIEPLSHGEVLEEALAVVRQLHPQGTILRSNHVSNSLALAGRYPRDREAIIAQAVAALQQARQHPRWFNEVPDYEETLF